MFIQPCAICNTNDQRLKVSGFWVVRDQVKCKCGVAGPFVMYDPVLSAEKATEEWNKMMEKINKKSYILT